MWVRFRSLYGNKDRRLDADLNGGGDVALYNIRFSNNDNTVVDRDANQPGNGARAQLWAKNFLPQQWWVVEAR
ncbi:hypothetical protein JOD54_003424 [Actinokineospora baliensis]|uniref:hypothetical protein n=1 Tax=Actinokineospora baliensis TaxID=547056 RepID=UPI001959F863|nr:hypothetical protein [Actinokineospora baliensis]MBM7773220.1 hypothetical protein [Actinokineospora baliensis]